MIPRVWELIQKTFVLLMWKVCRKVRKYKLIVYFGVVITIDLFMQLQTDGSCHAVTQ